VDAEELGVPSQRDCAACILSDTLSGAATGDDGASPSVSPSSILETLPLIKHGKLFRLSTARFPGMPLFPGHPPFQVLTYRSPQGIRAAGDKPWGATNEVGLGFISELVISSQHAGAHIDAHGHMTIGSDDHWYGGNAREDLGDFGPLKGDATEIPPIWRRAVFYDLPRNRGVPVLEAGSVITAEELRDMDDRDGVSIRPGDVAIIRTGYLSLWGSPDALNRHRGAGPDIGAARYLASRGVFAVGSDTDTFEVQPAPDPGVPTNPQPVHTELLIEKGIYIMESLFLEEIAAVGVREFLFVALPLSIRGATASMIDPVAVI
jgi:kynurenine formamidase